MTAPLVFAIRPQYVAQILARIKRVEYRTRRPNLEHGEQIMVYETAPMSKVVALVTTEGVISAKPAELWEQTSDRGGITREAFDRYFSGREVGHALELGQVVRLAEPLSLPAGMVAPQAWSRWRGTWPLE